MIHWTKHILGCILLVSLVTFITPSRATSQTSTSNSTKNKQVSTKNTAEKIQQGSSMITMDYAAYLAPVDLNYTKPSLPIEGMPVGNGKMGSLVWIDQSGSSIHLNIGRNDVFYRGSATATWTQDTHLDGNSKVGHVVINFPEKPFATKANQHLDTYNGYERIQGQDVSAKIVAWEDKDVFAIEITDNRPNPKPIEISLNRVRPDTIQNLYNFKSTYSNQNNQILLYQIASEKCNTGITENDFYNSSACVLAIQGRKGTIKENQFTVEAGKGTFTVYIGSSAGMNSTTDVKSSASAQVDAAMKSHFENILSSNQEKWHQFWQKSFIYLPQTHNQTFDKSLDQHWLYYLYCMNTCERGDYPINANGGIFNVQDGYQMWGSMYWWFNSSRQTLTPVFEQANHPELADPYFKMLSSQFAKNSKAAVQQWGTSKDAVYIQETFPFDGPEILPDTIAQDLLNTLVYKKEQTERLKKFDDKRSGWESRWSIAHRIGGYHSHLLYNTAEAAQWYWERYEYTKDLNWLREKAYPMLKGTAELYRTHPLTKKEADGKYHTNNLGWAETFWGGLRDGVNDLASIRGIFPVAIKAAKMLHVDSDLVPLWQEMLDNIAPYPNSSTLYAVGVLHKAGKDAYAIGARPDTKGKGPAGSEHDPRMMMVNIYDMVNTETKLTDPESWQTAMKTLEGLKVAERFANSTYEGEILSRFYGEMAKMGSVEWVKKCQDAYLKYWNSILNRYPNHMRRYDVNEQSLVVDWQPEGTLTEGLSASLLQSGATSPGGVPILRVFPAWPKEQDASFSLKAKGGFLVTSSIKNREVNFIEINSTLGGFCTIRNYWGNGSVDLYRNKVKSETLTGDLLVFKTNQDENIVLVNKGVNPSNVKVNLKPASEKVVNLVPSVPGKSPNYWCSWSAQSYMYGQGARKIDSVLYKVESVPKFSSLYLNEEVLFGGKGWLQNFHQRVKNDLYAVLDDGWDIPINKDYGYRNFSKLDPTKYPSFKGSIAENLVLLNKKTMEAGWRGIGLWYRAYEPAVDSMRKKSFKSGEAYKTTFWTERLEWTKNAGISYWKMDGGGDEKAYKMITSLAEKVAPNLIMEHGNASKDGPFNGYPGSGMVDTGYVHAGQRMLQYSEVMRLHDHSPQLGIATMLDRISSILAMDKLKSTKTGYLNCEDEVYIAAVLGGTMGIMRSPMVGLRPGDDPDIYLKGPRQIKRRMDEVVRAVRWERIAPAFGAKNLETHVDTKILTDTYKFPAGEFWTSCDDWDATYKSVNKIVNQAAPARVSRGISLPTVKCDDEPPFVIASRNPNGAISVGTLGRIDAQKGYYFPKADVTLDIKIKSGKIGIFGFYKTLTLKFEKPLQKSQIWAQDLTGDYAIDITSEVQQKENTIVIPGAIIEKIGLLNATGGDLSDPAIVLDIR
ncbi:MAG: DUF5703 domain-containing protein [Bacteroidia bacterium]|nr:DUF5703 domain-containing protein [Bacteroidia bacterium]